MAFNKLFWHAILTHVDARYTLPKAIISKKCSYGPKKCHFLHGFKQVFMRSLRYNAGFLGSVFETSTSKNGLNTMLQLFSFPPQISEILQKWIKYVKSILMLVSLEDITFYFAEYLILNWFNGSIKV